MIKKIPLYTLLLICLQFETDIVLSQTDPVVSRIINEGRINNRTMNHLDILSNRIGGRLVGSDAYENATYWAAGLFTKWGLEVTLQAVDTLPVGFNRGPWFGRMLSEDGLMLHFVTPSYTAGTKGVQRGHVVLEPKTRGEFERMKGKLKGAWVLITGESDGFPVDYSPFADEARLRIIKENEAISKYNDSIKRWNLDHPGKEAKSFKSLKDSPALFYKEMRESGILGIIQSAKVPLRALYDRKNLFYMSFDSLPDCPDIKLDEAQYSIILKKVKERQYFQLEFDIRNHFKPGPVVIHNVIGIIKGNTLPDEYVMCGGHLDSYDVGTGAIDCGSGVAPTLEAARLIALSGAKPKRSILFCLWAGEEFGLWGSEFWVRTNKDKLKSISNYFNRDGGPTVTSGITIPDAMYNDFEKICEPLNSINPDFPFLLKKRSGKPQPLPKIAGGSDHAYFAMNGVPAISFDNSDPKGYDFSYHEIWHTERDTYNISIPEYMNHTSVVTAVVLYNLANLDHLLSRDDLYDLNIK
ncbi:MAG: M28 family peptidase [Bacteroidales bacterium]|nr:M28 family peptidase [Bacteroidales bacterium]